MKQNQYNLTDRQTDRFNSIDLCKLIMAFAVVAVHTHPLEHCTNAILLNVYNIFVGMAVPFFFIASGYLLAMKMDWPYSSEKDLSRIWRQLKKITKMYIVWTIMYFPLAIYSFIADRVSPVKAVLVYIRGLFLIGEQYNSWPLWYLLSTIYSLLVIYFILKWWKNPKLLVVVSIIASIVSIGFSTLVSYGGNLHPIMDILRKLIRISILNGRIISGLVYIPIGMLLSKRRIPVYLSYVLLCVGCTANYFVHNYMINSYLPIIRAIGLFGVIESITFKNSPIFDKFRNMSIIIYLLHMYIWTFYYTIVYGEKTYGMDSFIVTSVVAVIISLLYLFAKNKRKAMHNESNGNAVA